MGAVNVGFAACPFSVCTMYTLQMPFVVESGPPSAVPVLPGGGVRPGAQLGSLGFAAVGVPYQAMSRRPSSPAAGQARTLLCRPGVGIVSGFDQWFPSSVELA